MTVISHARRLLLIGTACLVFAAPYTNLQVSAATSVTDLQAQKALLEQKAKAAQAAADQQKTVAQRAADKIAQVNGQIDQLTSSITDTQSNLSDVQTKIDQQNQQVADLESQLSQVERQKDAIIREMYITKVSYPDDIMLFSDTDLSKREEIQAHFDSLNKALQSVMDQSAQAKAAVIAARADLQKQNDNLVALQNQQQSQKGALADFRLAQSQLRDNANQAVVSLENQAKADQAQSAKLEDQISAALTAAINNSSRGIHGTGPGVGGRVHRGDLVGNEGQTGFATGPHVHFEVRVNNVPVNPQPYVNNGTLTWPISKFIITQGFGVTDFSYNYKNDVHTGLDLAGPYGEPVYAPADGTVILHDWISGYGHAWAEQLDNGLVVLLGHMI